MDSKVDSIFLDGRNYAIWVIDMEMLLESKGIWEYSKTSILDSMDD